MKGSVTDMARIEEELELEPVDGEPPTVREPIGLFRVHMYYEGDEFRASAKSVKSGIEGLLVMDSRPSVFVTVMAPGPAHAVAAAWETVKEQRAKPSREAESSEEFLKHMLSTIRKSVEDDDE